MKEAAEKRKQLENEHQLAVVQLKERKDEVKMLHKVKFTNLSLLIKKSCTHMIVYLPAFFFF